VLSLLIALLGLTDLDLPASAASSSAHRACDRYAAPQGSDRAPGTAKRPFHTPQRLVNSLHRGQTGCLRGGRYRFSLLALDTRGVTIRPAGSEAVTLKGPVKVLPGARGSTIKGLNLDGVGSKGGSPKIYASRVVLDGNRITNEHTAICVLVTAFYERPAPRHVVIERNRIHGCGHLPATNHQHGIYLAQSRGAVVRGNRIYANADRGIQLYPDARGSRIIHNVIDGNGQGIVVSGAGGQASSGNLIRANVITNSALGYNVYSDFPRRVGKRNLVRFNCVYGGAARARGAGGVLRPTRGFRLKGNVIADPRYANRSAGDFRLAAHSPCRSLGKRIALRSVSKRSRRRLPLRLAGRIPGPVTGPVKRARLEVKRSGRWAVARRMTTHSSGFAMRVRQRIAKGRRRVAIRVAAPGRAPSKPIRVIR
jgi:parallel beta-helix repeat protein